MCLTFSAWASRDFRLFCTVFSSSSSSEHLLQDEGFIREMKATQTPDWRLTWSR